MPAQRQQPRRQRPLLLAAIALGAFLLGRWSVRPHPALPATTAPVAAPACPETPTAVTPTCTSTAGLCPCPRPRPPATAARRPLPKRASPPIATSTPPPGDPTAATARYLRENAKRFATCAPSIGGAVRVHLEVTVAPSGTIDRWRVSNLDPLPAPVTGCVERVIRTLGPPGFDGSEPEVFALTVVL